MTIFIVDIEAVDTRYTKQWKEYLPKQLQRSTNEEVIVISGGEVPQATTPGAFLNFAGTNNYKSQQMLEISRMFANGEITNGDYFVYTDAWNPTVVQLRYMAELLGVDVRIGGLWHAGSYDPQDFLGRLIGDKPWVRHAERSMFDCYDHNFFATQFHIDLFLQTFKNKDNPKEFQQVNEDKIKRVGWPMEYLATSLDSYKNMPKEDIILFPHRVAPEKQVEIFRDLKEQLPQYEFIVCQEKELSKNDYHNLLGRAKMVFSANLQETLGISWYEGLLVDTIPMVPDRLSYSEMADQTFKYPSIWTKNFEQYKKFRPQLVDKVIDYMENYDSYKAPMNTQLYNLKRSFFSGEALYKEVSNG
jgi:glycosyltransferase involved in cell wall biosynthesis|tara:strand:- start:463 stop:1539 length:1077 start_codon:yes stop_codon:yes gene_type:complete